MTKPTGNPPGRPRKNTANSMQLLDQFIAENAGALQDQPQTGETADPGQIGYAEIPEDIALQETLSQIGESASEAKVIVYQIDEKSKKDRYLYECTVSEFASGGVSEIQSLYGAGEYRVRVYHAGHILTHRRVTIGAGRAAPTLLQTPASSLENTLAQNNANMLAGFEKIAASMRPAPQAGMGMQEVLTLIATLKPLFAPAAPAYAPPDRDPLDMLAKMLEIQKSIAPLPEGTDTGTAVLLEGIKTFGSVFSTMKQAEASTPRQAPSQAPSQAPIQAPIHQLPAPALLTNPVSQTPPLTNTEENKMTNTETHPEPTELQLKLAIIRPMIVTSAATDRDPYTYASMILDYFSDEEIEQYIDAPDWFEQLTVLIPEAPQFKPWFVKLREQVISFLTEETEPDSVPAMPNAA